MSGNGQEFTRDLSSGDSHKKHVPVTDPKEDELVDLRSLSYKEYGDPLSYKMMTDDDETFRLLYNEASKETGLRVVLELVHDE
jgi:hypothetical protein